MTSLKRVVFATTPSSPRAVTGIVIEYSFVAARNGEANYIAPAYRSSVI